MIISASALSANQTFHFYFLTSDSSKTILIDHSDSSDVACVLQVHAVITESEEVKEEHDELHSTSVHSVDVCLFCILVSEKIKYLPGQNDEPKPIETPLYILFHSLKIHLS